MEKTPLTQFQQPTVKFKALRGHDRLHHGNCFALLNRQDWPHSPPSTTFDGGDDKCTKADERFRQVVDELLPRSSPTRK